MSTDGKEKPVLVVCHESFDRSTLAGDNLLWLEYAFAETYPSDGFSAWETESSVSPAGVTVAAPCRAFTGGFCQQALNRFFAQAVIEHHVAAVIVVGLTGCTVDLSRVAALLGVGSGLILGEP
ncbi:MAG: hypothetical protein HOC23_11955, partial [Halieaceae bacterium]|nr:hypothetical protein [Halieaceae bacterium]